MSILFAIFGVGSTELLIVSALALLLFGHRVPSIMRNLGLSISEFRKGTEEIEMPESPDKLPIVGETEKP